MKKIVAVALLGFSVACLGQAAKSPTTKTGSTTKAGTPSASRPEPASSSPVTADEVDSFMKHMFGFQSGITWKVADISPSEAPGVTRVVVRVGEQSQVIYVLPGGKFAMAGEMIPFGADPFAPVREKLAAGAHGAVRGDPTAAVTVVEFSDLQCPHCKIAQPLVEKLLGQSPNAKLIYQPFPLPMHPWAKQAAAYAECMRQGSADSSWKFMNSVYDNQADITEANVIEKLNGLVRAAGSDAEKVAACADTNETAAKIQNSIDLGMSVGVNSTPTLFIQGRKVLGISEESLPSLKEIIDYEATHPK